MKKLLAFSLAVMMVLSLAACGGNQPAEDNGGAADATTTTAESTTTTTEAVVDDTTTTEGADDTIDKGRLGEECARLKEIFDSVSENSMILLDESLSSTGAYEASFIASEILTAFAVMRARGIFSTHLHELAASIPEINARSKERGGIEIDTLVAGIEEGQRSFKIYRMKPDGKSYARDIAEKYGLTFDTLISSVREEK